MQNFEAYNPTRIVFGKNQYHRIAELAAENKATKILVVYGGGSIKKNGVYEQIMQHLHAFQVVEFSGVGANPEYTTLMQAVELARK
ncbi:MAG TPA: iron-containing alcohol dehydrogenase, partial [Taishania sp.]|nr:iron-containing alcohol dehydrogenase [Taishania sp.]